MTQPCPNCGTLNSESSRFCMNCGTALKPAAQSMDTSSPEVFAAEMPSQTSQPITPVVSPDNAPSESVMPGAEMAAPTTSAESTSYVVKTTAADTSASDPQAATMPMNAYTPPPMPYIPPPAPQVAAQASVGTPGYLTAGSGRSEGATYAPYVAGTVATLERPKDTRSWLTPVIIVSAVVLLALGAISGYLLTTNKGTNNSTVSTPSGQVTTLPANASDEDKVKDVIKRSNQDQIKAWHDLDVNILKSTYTATVLLDNQKQIDELKRNNMYAVPTNEKLDIVAVQVDGDKATAHTVEVWTVTFFGKSDNQQLKHTGPDTLNETYYLVKVNGNWMVENIVIDDGKATPTSN